MKPQKNGNAIKALTPPSRAYGSRNFGRRKKKVLKKFFSLRARPLPLPFLMAIEKKNFFCGFLRIIFILQKTFL